MAAKALLELERCMVAAVAPQEQTGSRLAAARVGSMMGNAYTRDRGDQIVLIEDEKPL